MSYDPLRDDDENNNHGEPPLQSHNRVDQPIQQGIECSRGRAEDKSTNIQPEIFPEPLKKPTKRTNFQSQSPPNPVPQNPQILSTQPSVPNYDVEEIKKSEFSDITDGPNSPLVRNKDVVQLENRNSGATNQRGLKLEHLVEKFALNGSKNHNLTAFDIKIFANAAGKYADKESKDVRIINGLIIPQTLKGLMANGTKYFDAIVYLMLDPELRRLVNISTPVKDKDGNLLVVRYDESGKLMRYLFVIYFYIMLRGQVPSIAEPYCKQPIPRFIIGVMNIRATLKEMVEYVADFDLEKLDPQWVRKFPVNGLSLPASLRLGLGVAGYRIVGVFASYLPDRYDADGIEVDDAYDKTEEETVRRREKTLLELLKRTKGMKDAEREEVKKTMQRERSGKRKPKYLDQAIEVARSFKMAGYCWDFHPATRDPNVIKKYGSINKNATNLIIEIYKQKTIQNMLKFKKLAVEPQYDPESREYMKWNTSMLYTATSPIFP